MEKRSNRKGERGAVTIIEAAFVFPITFFIVFFMIMAGEGYYQYARAEFLVTHGAISAAARCENPMLSHVQNNGNSVPQDPGTADVMPYRYLFGGEAKSIQNEMEGELQSQISAMKPLLFSGMSPQNVDVSIDTKMNIFVSTVKVKCSFEVPFPIRMIFSQTQIKFKYTIEVMEPIGDPAEFIRNVTTVGDIIERNEAISNFVAEFKDKANKIGVYIN